MTESAAPWRRRALLASGVLFATAWIVGIPRFLGSAPSSLVFRDMPDLVPFRMLEASGTVSKAGALLAGLEPAGGGRASDQELLAEVRANPCAALFGTDDDARLPVAFFSDFNCPNCRVLNGILANYQANNPGILRIVRHELPLLGAASTIASEAVLAADLQGGYDAMHDRLMRAQMVTDLTYVVRMAESVGLDGQRLVADMQTPKIATALDRSKTIAKLFGFYGTPSTVIGRIAFIGAIPAADVDQIIQMERTAPKLTCSAA